MVLNQRVMYRCISRHRTLRAKLASMRRAPLILALLLSLGTALLALAPAWWQPSGWIVGNWYHPDCLSNHWLMVWVAERVSHGQSLLHNTRYYWPVGDYPVLAGNGTEGVLFTPFYLALGWPVGVPYYAMLVITLNGLSGWLLARAAGADRWAALLAAVALASQPYALREASSGRFNQFSICWLQLFLASWLYLLDAPSRRRALLSAAALALTAFFYWYYGFFAVLAGATLLGARVLWTRQLPPIRPLAEFSAAFLMFIAPWAYFFWSNWGLIPGTGEVSQFPHPEALNQARPLTWPFLIQEGTEIAHAMSAPGFALATLGVILALRPRRPEDPPAWRGPAALGLAAVWGAFYALSTGPMSAYSPYTLLYGLSESLRRFWWPVRHEAVAQAAAAALAALALSAILSRIQSEWKKALLGLLVALSIPLSLRLQGVHGELLLSEAHLPPAVYPTLAKRPGAGLVEPPISPATAGAQQQLIYQLYHGKTLLTGTALWVDRVRPDAWDEMVAQNSFLHAMDELERGRLSTTFSFQGEDLQELVAKGFRWYSINREMFILDLKSLVDTYSTLFTALFGQPALRGTGVKVWDAGQWNGKTEVAIPAFVWPRHLIPGGPSQKVNGKRPVSLSFGKGRGGGSLPGEF